MTYKYKKRDDNHCYNLIVAASRVIGKVNPSLKTLLILLRTSHHLVDKKLPKLILLKRAYRKFKVATYGVHCERKVVGKK